MTDQRRRRWSVIVQLLYKCFVFAGMAGVIHILAELLDGDGSDIIGTSKYQ